MLLPQTISYNGAVLTITRENVRSRVLSALIYRHFDFDNGMDDGEFLLLQNFVHFMTQCKVDGDIGFPVPSPSAEKSVIMAAFDAFLDLPADFYDAFAEAYNAVNTIIGDAETTPDNAKKKAPKS